jgi:hypothetical protein
LIGWVEEDEDITMPELAARLARETQMVSHRASLSRFPNHAFAAGGLRATSAGHPPRHRARLRSPAAFLLGSIGVGVFIS